MKIICFTVYGNPIPKARARTVRLKNGFTTTYTPQKTENWENMIRLQILEHKPDKLIDQAISLKAVFVLQRPKSIPKKRKYPETKPDLDNLLKSLTDAMEGIIYTNDSRIVKKEVSKVYGDPPRVEVELEVIAHAETNMAEKS